MSFARYGCDGSSVYVYEDATLGGFTCLHIGDEEQLNGDYDFIVAHLQEHRAQGDTVPESTFTDLAAHVQRYGR